MHECDKKMRWKILLLLFITRLSLGIQFQTMASTGDYIFFDLGLSFTAIGTLIGLFMLPGMFLALPAGLLGRYVSDRLLTSIGLVLLGLGGLIIAFGSTYDQLALGRLCCGAGFVVTNIYFTKMTADWFTSNELGTAISALVMSYPAGIALGQIGYEWLAEAHGWQSAFFIASAYCFLAGGAVMALYRSPSTVGLPQAGGKLTVLTLNEFILTTLASLAWGFLNAGYVVYLSFGPKALITRGVGALEAATIVSLASWVMIFSGIFVGYVADRIGRNIILIYLGVAVGVGAILLTSQPGYAILASLALGIFGFGPGGLVMALSNSAMAPARRAFGMGYFFSLYFLMVSLAPMIAGWLFERTNDAFTPLVFGAGTFAMIIPTVFVFALVRRHLNAA